MARESKSGPARGLFKRSSKLLGLAAQLAQKELKTRVKSTWTDSVSQKLLQLKNQASQARDLVESLSQLKGAAMKAGQMLALELRDYLPAEVVEILRELQDSSEPVDFSEIQSILKAEWGQAQWAKIESVSETPLASASIGQVHRVQLKDGTSCVAKIQFRGIAEAIDSDVALLGKIAGLFLKVTLKKVALEGVIDEIRSVLKMETNFLQEAEHLRTFGLLLHGVKADPQMSYFRVPSVVTDLTTQNVLVMSFEEGLRLEDWIKSQPSEALKRQVAGRFLALYYHEFYVWGRVQTDPNFGNFLFDPKTQEVVLLDFGATKVYEASFREKYAQLLIAVFDEDRPRVSELCFEIGLVDRRESPETMRLLYELMRSVLSAFKDEHQPFDFADPGYAARTRESLKAFFKSLEYSPPPSQLVFLHRKLGGLFSLLRTLKVKVDLRPFVELLRKGYV